MNKRKVKLNGQSIEAMSTHYQQCRRAFLQGLSLASAGLVLQQRLLFSLAADTHGKESLPNLGVNASLNGKQVFPLDNPWNKDISQATVDPNSSALITSIGLDKPLHPDFGKDPRSGIPYVIVTGNQPRKAVRFEYPDESDTGVYPIPEDAPIEG